MKPVRRKHQRLPGRGPARWTPLEISLIVVSLLMIVFPLYAEVYRWAYPTIAPAAELGSAALQRPTLTNTPGGDQTPLPTDPAATATPTDPAATPTDPAATPVPTDPATPVPTDPAATPTDPAATPVPTDPAATPVPTDPAATPVPTDPGVPTSTPTEVVGEPPLSIEKIASLSTAGVGQEFSYSISVFSTSPSATSVRVDDDLDPQLVLVSATASNGSCNSGDPVSCTVNVQADQPAVIVIRVRVGNNATQGGRIVNQAIGQTSAGLTATSDQVFVEVAGVVPTVPTATQGSGPTNTPVPGTTNTPVPGATNTPVPGATNTPVPGATNTPVSQPATPRPTNRPPAQPGPPADEPPPEQPKPTTPPQPPLPPTARPGAPPTSPPASRPAGTTRPQATARPGGGGTNATAPAATGSATTTAAPATATSTLPTPESGLFFRMVSDWGSAFPDQQVNYVIAVKNNRPAGAADLVNLEIQSELPANLQVLGAQSDRGGDPTVAGNAVSLKLPALKPGESVEIAIQTQIKPDVAAGTRIVSQASLTYDGQALRAYSNVVSLLVVGAAQITATAQNTSVATVPATTQATTQATSAPTAATGVATATTAPASATDTPTAAVAGGAAASGAPTLPATSAGVPILGVALLGLTMMVRTVRVHRAQSRL